jgi:hypothetical protein
MTERVDEEAHRQLFETGMAIRRQVMVLKLWKIPHFA